MANNLIERLIRHTLDNPSFLLKNKNDDEKFVIEGSQVIYLD